MISVVIPTCHRNDLLAHCLERLAPGSQTLPWDAYEVIVTDDGTCSTAQAMIAEHYPWAKWVAGPRRGPAANRNHGARCATGEWIAFTDDDCLPDAGWLQALHETAAGEPLDVIEGKTVCPGKRDDPFQEQVDNLNGDAYWSCNLAIRREVFAAMQGFDEAFLEACGEDMEFAWRIKARNLRVRFVPSFLVIHPPRFMTWGKLWRRVFMLRWMLLYRLRIGEAPPLDAPPLRVIGQLLADRSIELLRTTSHLITKFDAQCWRRQFFYQSLKWVMFPLVMPYLILWEFRFRRQLRPTPSQPTR